MKHLDWLHLIASIVASVFVHPRLWRQFLESGLMPFKIFNSTGTDEDKNWSDNVYLDYFHHALDKMVRHFVRNRLWTLETFVRNVLCEQNWTKIFWRVTFSKGISFQISFVLSNLSVNPICEHQRLKDLKLTNLFPLFSSRSTMFSHISLLNLCKCRWIRLIWAKCPFWNGENAFKSKLCKVKMWSFFCYH